MTVFKNILIRYCGIPVNIKSQYIFLEFSNLFAINPAT